MRTAIQLLCDVQESTGSLRGLVRQLSIDQFENEGRRVMGAESASKSGRTPIFDRTSMDPGSIHKVHHLFLGSFALHSSHLLLCAFCIHTKHHFKVILEKADL